MVCLRLDAAAVASAWTQLQGGGSIFADPCAAGCCVAPQLALHLAPTALAPTALAPTALSPPAFASPDAGAGLLAPGSLDRGALAGWWEPWPQQLESPAEAGGTAAAAAWGLELGAPARAGSSSDGDSATTSFFFEQAAGGALSGASAAAATVGAAGPAWAAAAAAPTPAPAPAPAPGPLARGGVRKRGAPSGGTPARARARGALAPAPAAGAPSSGAGGGPGERGVRSRQAALARYLGKKARRGALASSSAAAAANAVRYQMRKVNAERRPRVNGRFACKGDPHGALAAAAAEGPGAPGAWAQRRQPQQRRKRQQQQQQQQPPRMWEQQQCDWPGAGGSGSPWGVPAPLSAATFEAPAAPPALGVDDPFDGVCLDDLLAAGGFLDGEPGSDASCEAHGLLPW